MAQTVLRQVLILAVMMMLGFLLGKRGKVDRKGADLLSMLLLDVFFPCNILAAASGDFGDMPFSQVIKIALAYMSCFILFSCTEICFTHFFLYYKFHTPPHELHVIYLLFTNYSIYFFVFQVSAPIFVIFLAYQMEIKIILQYPQHNTNYFRSC